MYLYSKIQDLNETLPEASTNHFHPFLHGPGEKVVLLLRRLDLPDF